MDKNVELLMISRQLSPEHKVELLDWANKVCEAEGSGKSTADDVILNIESHIQLQDFSCKKKLQRSKT